MRDEACVEQALLAGEATPEPAPISAVTKYFAIDLCRSLARLVCRRRRSQEVVNEEYDHGAWREVLERRAWEAASDLAAFLIGDDRTRRLVRLGGRLRYVPTREYYRARVGLLQALLEREAGDVAELVELGCGFGYNLFSLSLSPRWTFLHGFDVSENGLRAGTAIAERFGLIRRVRFGLMDLANRDDPAFDFLRNRTVFTFFCLEQLPTLINQVLCRLAESRPRRVVHVEPTTELLRPWVPRDLLNYLYVWSRDYQRSLFSTLRSMAAGGQVRIVSEYRLDWAATPHQDGFVVAWEPR